MYKTILVAYDGAEFSESALKQAADLATLCKAELHLFAVVSTIGGMALAEAAGSVDVLGIEQKHLKSVLDDAAKRLSAEGVRVATAIRMGSPGHEIAEHAHEIHADLVVLGRSDKGLLGRWLEGSVGSAVLRNMPCSVLIATA